MGGRILGYYLEPCSYEPGYENGFRCTLKLNKSKIHKDLLGFCFFPSCHCYLPSSEGHNGPAKYNNGTFLNGSDLTPQQEDEFYSLLCCS